MTAAPPRRFPQGTLTSGARAPGKIMIAGEYAVLDGGEALLMAVDRYAIAHAGPVPPELPPLLAAVRDAVIAARGGSSEAARAAAAIRVDSSALQAADGRKLGLGSSAAACVAATGCALAAGGADLDRQEVHRIAHAAHQAAQAATGHPGSGADVAASVWGGIVAVRADRPGGLPVVRAVSLPGDLHLVAVWTGLAAPTAPLVAAVHRLRERDPDAWTCWRDAIDLAAAALIRACVIDDPGAALTALATGATAVAALGQAAGVALETDAHRSLATLAGHHGGACKPAGAGGGDLAVAAFTDAATAQGFRDDVAAAGLTCVDLQAASGVEICA